MTIKTKYLVYKGCKKNVHRLWKLNGDKGKSAASTSGHNGKYAKSGSLFGAGLNGRDDEKIKRITDQTIQENIRTTEKMNQLRLKMELANARKKLKSIKFPIKTKSKSSELATSEKPSRKNEDLSKELHDNGVEKPMCSSSKLKEPFNDKVIQRQMKQDRYLSAESKLKIKENLSRNRSFKTIISPPALASSSSLSFFNNDINPMEFCFSGSGDVLGPTNKLGRSLSFQSNYVFNRTDSNLCVNNASGVNSLATMESTTISNSTPIIQEYVGPICEPESTRAIGTKVKETKKPAYSTSMQDLLLKEFLTKSTPNSYHMSSSNTLQNREYSSANMEFSACKKSSRECAFKNSDEKDMLRGAAITKSSAGGEINEYFILPKLLIREDSPSVFESPLSVEEIKPDSVDVAGSTTDLLDIASAKQPSAESLIEFYDNSSIMSKLNDYGCFPSFHQPSANRFYHSDLDLNQLNDRFKNKLSISNQDINTSEGNLGTDSDWSRSNLLLLSAINQTKDEPSNDNIIDDVNYDKFLNDLLSTEYGSSALPCTPAIENEKDEASGTSKVCGKDNMDLFGNDLDSTLLKKSSVRRVTPHKKPTEKLKSFGSNPTLLGHHSLSTHESSNLTGTTTTSTTTVNVNIPQLSRLDAIPTKYRRGKIA